MEAIFQLKMPVQTIKPQIWRTIRVPNGFNFNRLHLVVQCSFGWTEKFDYKFEGRLGDATNITIMPLFGVDYVGDAVEETQLTIDQVLRQAGDKGKLFFVCKSNI